MENKLEIELYNDLRSVCEQARTELNIAYKYFEKCFDNNGMYILFHEICGFDDLFSKLDYYDPKIGKDIIPVPNIYERGFYMSSNINEVKARTDPAVINAVSQKKIRTNQKLYMDNGSFYGYYCYNIYNKCMGWINYALKKYSIITMFNQLVVDYFESTMQYFMRFEG